MFGTEDSQILKAQYKIRSPGRHGAGHFYIPSLSTVHTYVPVRYASISPI